MEQYDIIRILVQLVLISLIHGSVASTNESSIVKRQLAPVFVSLTNCWPTTSEGLNGVSAQSQVDFFYNLPVNFGNARPDHTTSLTWTQNYVWEQGGSVEDKFGYDFTWTIEKTNATTDQVAGYAADNSTTNYIVKLAGEKLLYAIQGQYIISNCLMIYSAQLPNKTDSDTASNFSATAAASVGLPLATEASIAAGASVAGILLIVLSALVFRRFPTLLPACVRCSSIFCRSTARPSELEAGKKKYLSRSMILTTSTMSHQELHHQHVIEMAGTDRSQWFGRVHEVGHETGHMEEVFCKSIQSPVEIYTRQHRDTWR